MSKTYQRGPSVPDDTPADFMFEKPWMTIEYLEDIPEQNLILTISDTTREKVYVRGEGDVLRKVVWFHEIDLGLIVNKTRNDQITKLCGKTAGEWKGKAICVYLVHDVYNPNKGKKSEAIRVKAPPTLTPEQAVPINEVGQRFYADEWVNKMAELAKFFSGGRTEAIMELYGMEGHNLLEVLNERIDQHGTYAQAMAKAQPQQEAQPQAQPAQEEEPHSIAPGKLPTDKVMEIAEAGRAAFQDSWSAKVIPIISAATNKRITDGGLMDLTIEEADNVVKALNEIIKSGEPEDDIGDVDEDNDEGGDWE